ncbi:DUF3566 domain-containing protein [Nesterenkonia flava]|uniref:DUF3566 domain-containing protein n=1 Tax=Nesterenkonia flava TaxID=469799 RepID=A0ABU1FT22_9MICC|nr:DUF3566 domain-containing protein [Nesterenkonia flava]MDR5711811.1 DUF3566 domain-containing protein [Nesterenkonia flava]
MSANTGENQGSSGSNRPASRFPAPRPRASQSETGQQARPSAPSAARPRPRPQPAGRPAAGGRPQARPQGPRPAGQRPGGGRPQPQLVRPTPKAKVRKARLLVSKVDPWSVLKMSFLLSVALGIMTVVCAVTLWSAMNVTGIFDRVNDLLGQVLGTEGGGTSFQIEEMVTVGQVASFATIIAVVNVVLLTVLSMLAAVLYNLSASLVGGIGVTLTDD